MSKISIQEIAKIVLSEIDTTSLLASVKKKGFVLVAIDGRCGAGKTTLAAQLKEMCECSVIHMDHFFPRLEQRTAERLSKPGGNIDHERFLDEVMMPLLCKETFSYCPFNPHKNEMLEAIQINPNNTVIIEGSYSCHPLFFDYYDLRVFLDISEEERHRRILLRNGKSGLIQFKEKWIPMEESYFSAFSIEERCGLRFKTG